MVRGGCLCGAITLAAATVGAMTWCHCKQCRKTAGAPFLAVVPVARDALQVSDPQQLLGSYRASPAKARHFCTRCGSPLFSERDGHDVVRVRAGALELDADVVIAGHIYCADAAPWDRFDDALPRYAGLEPGRGR